MTKTKPVKFGRMAIASVLCLIMALFAFSVPAYAAEADPELTGTTEASVSFTAGVLKLVSAPALDFGAHPVSGIEESYEAESVSSVVQVSDLRGSGTGWDLMASLSEFSIAGESGDMQSTLAGASITSSGATVSAVNGTVGTPPAQQSPVELPSSNTQVKVLTAGSDAGMGVWSMSWQAANTKLVVKPGTAREGTSVATLTWSLQSTP